MRNFAKLIRITRFIRNMPFYAVAKGNRVGIHATWDECKAQVNGYSGAKFKKFKTNQEAEAYLASNGVGTPQQLGNGYSGANFKKFNSNEEAEANLASNGFKTLEQEVRETGPKNQVAEKVPFVDFWPDDISDGEEDDYLLAAVAAEFDPVPTAQNSRKRQLFDPTNKKGLIDLLKKLRKASKVVHAAGHKNYGEHQFPVDAEGFVLAYTDGSCENNGRHNAVAGLGVYFDDNHPLNASQPVTGKATNNAGEIQAACEAIRIAQKCNIDKLCINTDSQFLINSVTIWMRSWKRKNWTLSDGNPVKNLEDYTTLDKLISGSRLKIRWNYVKGHAGIEGNEGADRLAKQGASMYVLPKKKWKRGQ